MDLVLSTRSTQEGFCQASSAPTTSSGAAVAAPRRPTTTEAAAFASMAPARMSVPAASASTSALATVSPAPVTSATSPWRAGGKCVDAPEGHVACALQPVVGVHVLVTSGSCGRAATTLRAAATSSTPCSRAARCNIPGRGFPQSHTAGRSSGGRCGQWYTASTGTPSRASPSTRRLNAASPRERSPGPSRRRGTSR